MRLPTHMYVAQQAIDVVENATGIGFNHKFVRIGSCMPDVLPSRRIQLHTPQLAIQMYDQILDKLTKETNTNAKISYLLGIMSHYIADAFCVAHNLYTSDLKKHVQYERALENTRKQLTKPLVDKKNITQNQLDMQYSTPVQYMQKQNDMYIKKIQIQTWNENIYNDLITAITESAVILTRLIFELQEQKIPAFAV